MGFHCSRLSQDLQISCPEAVFSTVWTLTKRDRRHEQLELQPEVFKGVDGIQSPCRTQHFSPLSNTHKNSLTLQSQDSAKVKQTHPKSKILNCTLFLRHQSLP